MGCRVLFRNPERDRERERERGQVKVEEVKLNVGGDEAMG